MKILIPLEQVHMTPKQLWRGVCLTVISMLSLSGGVQAQMAGEQLVPLMVLLLDGENKTIPVDGPIQGVKTSVAAFIGVTKTGAIYQDRPTKVTSWLDFLAKFGGYTATAPFMAPAVSSFFVNGGLEAYIVKTQDNSDSAVIGNSSNHTGLSSLSRIDEVSIVLAPGLTSQTVTSALIAHSELMGDRIAIIDAPENGNSVSFLTNPTTGYVNTLGSSTGHAAIYSPWYLAPVVLQNGNTQQMYIPPSGGVAGVYARVDRERGVYKSPANQPLLDALNLKVGYTSEERSQLNTYNVNTLITDSQNSILIWGARTTSSGLNLKYVAVSRFLMYLAESIEEGTQWVASEINAEPLWIRVRQRIDDFLYLNWRSGALMGTNPDDAYFVRCDATTMTVSDISNGRLKCLYGLAVTKPAEFEILWLEQNTL